MITKFSDYLKESLAAAVSKEPSSEAAKQAKQMSLSYVGFGRYADKSGAVKYIVKGNHLVPFQGKDVEQESMMNTNQQLDVSKMKGDANTTSFLDKKQKQSITGIKADEKIKNDYKKQNAKLIATYDKKLKSLYLPSLFSEDEFTALNTYANQSAAEINRYLYKGFDIETNPDQANQIVEIIKNLDNAFQETGAPFDYTSYVGLSPRYVYDKIKPNSSYNFRGYVSASLNHDNIIDMLNFDQTQPVGCMMELDIKEGQKSIYMDGLFGDNRNTNETLLPRGTKIVVVSNPMILDNDIASSGSSAKQIALFKCNIAEE